MYLKTDTPAPMCEHGADLNTKARPDHVEGPDLADQDSSSTSTELSAGLGPDRPAGGSEDEEKFNVELFGEPSDSASGASEAEVETEFRPEIQDAVTAGQIAGAEICQLMKDAAELKKNAAKADAKVYATVVASAVFLRRTMIEQELQEFFRRRGIPSTSYQKTGNHPAFQRV